jgi:pyrroloquinoline quinone biosynthesis protein B
MPTLECEGKALQTDDEGFLLVSSPIMERCVRASWSHGSTVVIPIVALLLLLGAACSPAPVQVTGEAPASADAAGVKREATASAALSVPRTELPEGPVVLVLGSVQDGGFPHAGCYGPHCEAARRDPSLRRLVASLGVLFPREGLRYLIDATPDIRPQLDALEKASPRIPLHGDRDPLDGVLLTHAHIGHYLGLAFLGYESIHTTRVPVLCTPAMADFLATNAPWDQLVRLENIVAVEMEPGQTFHLHKNLAVTPVKVPHRDEYADTVGWILRGPEKALLYVPDTDSWEAWDPPLTERLEGIDVAILDATFYSTDELPGRPVSAIGHPLIQRSMDLLQPLVDSGRLEVYFTHLNHSNLALDPVGTAARTIGERGFHIAAEGTEIPL